MRHVSRLSEGVTGSIYDIRTGCLCVCVCLCASIARKVCVEKVGREEIQVNVATYHIRRVRRVLSMRARARVFHLPLISAKVVFVLNKVQGSKYWVEKKEKSLFVIGLLREESMGRRGKRRLLL